MTVVIKSDDSEKILPKTKTSTLHIIAIFSKREKSPKVTTFNGKVKMSRIGLIAKFITPRARPAKAICDKSPKKTTPGIPVANQIPMTPTII